MARTFDLVATESNERSKLPPPQVPAAGYPQKAAGDLPRIQKILNSPPESSEQHAFSGQQDAHHAIELLEHFRSQHLNDQARRTGVPSGGSSSVLPAPPAPPAPAAPLVPAVPAVPSSMPTMGPVPRPGPGPGHGHPPAPPMQIQYMPQGMQFGYNVHDRFKEVREAAFHLYNLTCTQGPSNELILSCMDHLTQLRHQMHGSFSPQFGPGYLAYPQAPVWDSREAREPIIATPPAKQRRKRARGKDSVQCHECGTQETPEWRRGPDGARTLCNACGLYHAKIAKKQGDEHATQKLRERRLRNRE